MIAVIFDMDGVLVNNARFHERAFAEYFSQYGVVLEQEMHGRGNKELMVELFPDETDERRNELATGKEEYYRKIYEPHIEPAAGLIDLLNNLKHNNIPLAVGSSAEMKNIDFVLDKLQIRNYFDVIAIAEMVEKAKPAPDIYLKAAELLKIKPENCVVFEDALAGVEAAKAAGMKVVGITTSLTNEQLAVTDRVINDFSEITVDEIRTLVK